MSKPDDFTPPEVIDLEIEADARGYFAYDEDEPPDAGGPPAGPPWVVGLSVPPRRR
jgi:hypothetical protein